MSARQTEIVDIESLDIGAVVLLGMNRDPWKLEQNDEVDGAEWLRVRLAKVDGAGEIKRTFHRTAKFETVCG